MATDSGADLHHHATADAAPRVLVVDDNPINIDLTLFVLAADGIDAEGVTDEGQMLDALHSFRPDLVLMDVQIPGTDGLAMTRRIKADPSLRHTVVIAYTAYAMKGDADKMRAAGCDGYLAKPIDVASFAGEVRALLAAARRPASTGPCPA